MSHASLALILVIIAIGGVSISLDRAHRVAAAVDAQRDAEVMAARVARAAGDVRRLGVIVADERRRPGVVAVIDERGAVIAGAVPPAVRKRASSVLEGALAGGSTIAVDGRRHEITASAPVIEGRDVMAATLVIERIPPLVPWRGALGWTIASCTTVVALAALLGWVLSGAIARPLREVVDDAHAAALGSGRRPMKGSAVPEVATVAAAVDRLARRLEELRREMDIAHPEEDMALRRLSHQLRTPLGILELRLGELGEADLDPERQQEVLAVLSRQVDLLDGASQRLGDLARHKVATSPTEVVVDEVIADIVDRFAPLASWSRVEISKTEGEPCILLVDRVAFDDSVSNLVDNAIKFSPSGGTVRIGWEIASDSLVVTIEDEGPGIPDVEHALVRRPWARGSGAADVPGTGLGLSLVDQFAKSQGGVLQLDRATTGGLSARLTLPLSPSGGEPPRSPFSVGAGGNGSHR